MTQFFEISKANMAGLYRLAGLPEGEAMVFPVIKVETNMIGAKGFDAFYILDTTAHPELMLSKEHTVAAHRGHVVAAPVEVIKARKYYTLFGQVAKGDTWEQIFGDYDRACVVEEKEYTFTPEHENYHKLVVIGHADTTEAMFVELVKLNAGK